MLDDRNTEMGEATIVRDEDKAPESSEKMEYSVGFFSITQGNKPAQTHTPNKAMELN